MEALNTFKSDNKLTIEDVISKSALINDESKKELDKIKKVEDTINREKLVYKTSKNTYDFRKFQTIRTFGKGIYDGKITLEDAEKDKTDLMNEIKNVYDKTRPKTIKKTRKRNYSS